MKKISNLLILAGFSHLGFGQNEAIVIGGSLNMTLESNRIQVNNNSLLFLNPAGGGVDIGNSLRIFSTSDSDDNMVLHDDEIYTRKNGSPSTLSLNRLGGNVELFKNAGGSFIVHGLTVGDFANMQYNTSTGRFYYDSSTRRYKENITALQDDWTKILQVRPVTYTRPGDTARWEYGYIAEEIDSIGLTTMVGYDGDGNPEDVRYDKMIIYLVEMIKIQQKEINELKGQLSGRKRKLTRKINSSLGDSARNPAASVNSK
jgi:hypothetical protein